MAETATQRASSAQYYHSGLRRGREAAADVKNHGVVFKKQKKDDATFTFEIIVVDDGSNDATASTRHQSARNFPENNLVVVRLPKNRGKGGAVKEGVAGVAVLMCCWLMRTGATDIRDHASLEARALAGDCAVVCGSRAHLVDTAVVARRSMIREIF